MDFLWEGVCEAFRLIAGADEATLHALWVSLLCTLVAVTVAAMLAIPYGAWLGLYRPRGHRVQYLVLRVGLALPTVVIGLIVFGLLSRRGILGDLDLLYTRTAIVTGEFLLAFPLLGSLSHGATASLSPRVVETALTLGASRWRALLAVLGEVRAGMTAAYLTAFGRCITELGIAITVGGNLAMRTRTLPSTIQLEISVGNFAAALAPGLILLVLAGVVAVGTHFLSQEEKV